MIQARIAHRKEIAGLPLERFKFVDESGVNIAMTRLFGRAVRGERVHDAIPKNHGSNVTILGALSCQGIDAVMTIEGATDTEVFRAYVSKVLARTREALEEALRYAIDLITAADARAWFAHCGYPLH